MSNVKFKAVHGLGIDGLSDKVNAILSQPPIANIYFMYVFQ